MKGSRLLLITYIKYELRLLLITLNMNIHEKFVWLVREPKPYE
jgi:hypothetical protein